MLSKSGISVYGLVLNLNFAQPADLSALNNGRSKKFNNFPFTLTDSSRTDPILSEITRPGSDLHLCFPTQYYQLANHISWSYPSDCRKSRTMVWNRLTFFSKVGYKLLIKILIGQFNYNGLSPNFSLPYSPGNDDVVLVHTCGCAAIFSPWVYCLFFFLTQPRLLCFTENEHCYCFRDPFLMITVPFAAVQVSL